MKLIKPSFKILEQSGYAVSDVLKFITQVAYTCYKTEKEITGESAIAFVNKLIKSGHMAMLEHGTIYLRVPYDFFSRLTLGNMVKFYQNNPYSKVVISEELIRDEYTVLQKKVFHDVKYANITTNLRVIEENNKWGDLDYICKPSEHHALRHTVRFITDRGVSHELVRHRVFSFAQESTRYCNYGQDKFGNEITFIIPTWYDESEKYNKDVFDNFLTESENTYLYLVNHEHYTPQEARQVLPNALKTEIILTAFESDWVHFFNLRALGTTGKPHPDMKYLASMVLYAFVAEFPYFREKFKIVQDNG